MDALKQADFSILMRKIYYILKSRQIVKVGDNIATFQTVMPQILGKASFRDIFFKLGHLSPEFTIY